MQILLPPSRLSAFFTRTIWRNFPPTARSLVSSAPHLCSSVPMKEGGLPPGGPGTRASEEQLIEIKEKMLESIPRLFKRQHNFADYHPNVQLEDNIRNVRSSGILNYYYQVTQTRVFCEIRYAACSVTVLKATHDIQDSKVCIRWKFEAHSVLNYVNHWLQVKLRKFKLRPCRVIDGFSIMYVGGDGRVWKHVIEKMIPDTDADLRNDPSKPLISKIEGASLASDPKPQ